MVVLVVFLLQFVKDGTVIATLLEVDVRFRRFYFASAPEQMRSKGEYRRSVLRFFSKEGATMTETMTKSRPGMTEGVMARTLEEQTAKLPSDAWLWAAVGSMGVSLFMHLSGRREDGHFIGQWAAPFLLLGVYNKLVKLHGSDHIHP